MENIELCKLIMLNDELPKIPGFWCRECKNTECNYYILKDKDNSNNKKETK